MKKITLLFLFSLFIFGTHSQEKQERSRQRMTVEERAAKTTQWMTTELSLSQEQIPPVDSINLLYTKAQYVLIQSAEGDREKIREALSALETQKTAALKTVLSPDQMEIYKKKAEELKNRFKNREQRSRE